MAVFYFHLDTDLSKIKLPKHKCGSRPRFIAQEVMDDCGGDCAPIRDGYTVRISCPCGIETCREYVTWGTDEKAVIKKLKKIWRIK